MYSTLDFSLMKAAGAFSLPPSYHTVKPACLLPHCVCQQKGHRSLMPASWKWVTAPCHVADLYPDGALCLGTKEHGFPRSLTFSAAIMTTVLSKLREKSKCTHWVGCAEPNSTCLVDTTVDHLLVVRFDVYFTFYILLYGFTAYWLTSSSWQISNDYN